MVVRRKEGVPNTGDELGTAVGDDALRHPKMPIELLEEGCGCFQGSRETFQWN